MDIERGTLEHIEHWARLRAALWPDQSAEEHRDELIRTIREEDERASAFVVRLGSGEIVGFAEAALRADYVNGCETSPVLFLEGIYVRPDHRRRGMARRLCDAVAAWGRSMGCIEFASDALLDNEASHRLHAALGFEETERVVFFRKAL
ncbi:aminoglycoside 6'-N-acetyltransferase AAC(6')-E141 [Inquilinus limosus]|uniref:aminoglycoside 6'-N-acetyltransferase AAC(6')-E141 n=1 Tax=Inquilinus limosus TaxID=171674 RepID=UPI00041C53CC|nr:aminoglycoside 6'-N-acetyltransferase AAC(6')-E141 [Inquilinus limosus]